MRMFNGHSDLSYLRLEVVDNGDHDAAQFTGYGRQGHADVEMLVQGTHGTMKLLDPTVG